MQTGSYVGLFVFLCVYFAPWLLALKYDKSDTKKIFFINLFTGWTFVGWLAAFFLACRYEEKKSKIKINN